MPGGHLELSKGRVTGHGDRRRDRRRRRVRTRDEEVEEESQGLLIISDGGDNSSRYTEGEVKRMVRENDVLIYAVGVFEAEGARSRSPEEALFRQLQH